MTAFIGAITLHPTRTGIKLRNNSLLKGVVKGSGKKSFSSFYIDLFLKENLF